jgi:hypothetical protein
MSKLELGKLVKVDVRPLAEIEAERVDRARGNNPAVAIVDEHGAHAHTITEPAQQGHHAHMFRQLGQWQTSRGDPTPREAHYSRPLEMHLHANLDEVAQVIREEMSRALGIPERLLAGGEVALVDPEAEQRARNLSTVAALYNAPCLPR